MTFEVTVNLNSPENHNFSKFYVIFDWQFHKIETEEIHSPFSLEIMFSKPILLSCKKSIV